METGLTARLGRLQKKGKLQVRAAALPWPLSAGQMAVVGVSSLGVGLSPILPATVASFATVVAAFALRNRVSQMEWLMAAAVVMVIGTAAGSLAERSMKCSDPRWFILDEVVGQLMFFGVFAPTLLSCAAGLVLFRVFDVLKLPPAEQLEGLHGGWGIMLDDVAAGIYATAVWFVVIRAAAWAGIG